MSTVATDRLHERYGDTGLYRYHDRREEPLFPNAIAIPLRGRLSGKPSRRRAGNRQTRGQAKSAPGKRARQQAKRQNRLGDPAVAMKLRQQALLDCQRICVEHNWLHGPSLSPYRW